MRIEHKNEQGFTLPELFAVTGVIVLFVLVSVVLLRPASYATELQNGQRRTDIARLAQALQRYKADSGQYPAGIPTDETAISSLGSGYALCAQLVPKYLKDLPFDPEAGGKVQDGEVVETEEPCTAEGFDHSLGYSIRRDDSGAVILRAPSAQNEKIEITIR